LAAYDVVGVQVTEDAENLNALFLKREAQLRPGEGGDRKLSPVRGNARRWVAQTGGQSK
jgi:hypothetical protein